MTKTISGMHLVRKLEPGERMFMRDGVIIITHPDRPPIIWRNGAFHPIELPPIGEAVEE
jgi:hypothetical protein